MRHTTVFQLTALVMVCSLPGCSGCGGYDPPRTRDEIAADQIAVDTIYFKQDGTQFHAPGTKRGMIVDDAGQLAHAAWQCNNAECPGRGDEGSPYLFPSADPFAYVDETGQPAIRQPETEADFKLFEDFIERKCPKCLEIRQLDSETDQQRQQYQGYLVRHVTSKAEQQLAELEAEMKAYLDKNQPTN